ncbi:hypothetical protein QCA50_016237 [Cerrena zonata]|uniref:Uncharacterized protein n=1 Tax=Cerrena zonata TaxID=2478898 RepID=A0AAW0FMA5_9APHY
MLQENPIFRPNIIQVIILVATMMKLDFKDLKIEDFYKVGPYNFHALHEYQRQKQQELIQQQQFYYQQQQQQLQQNQQLAQTLSQKSSSTNLVGKVPPADPSNPTYAYSSPVQQPAQAAVAPNLQPQTQEQLLAYQQQQSQFPIQEQSLVSPYKDQYPVSQPADQQPSSKLDPELQDEKFELNEKHNAEDSDDLEGLEENLDNVEERYPSLEDLLDTPQKPRDDTTISNKSKLLSESPPASSSPAPSIKPPSYPVKPIILLSPEIKKLNPEELQQYNYQHQVYQSQFQYYQQMQQQQQKQHNQHQQQKFQKSQEKPAGLQSPVPQYSSKSSKSSRISGEGSKTPTAFESKEAWEKLHSKIDKSAERLADDIFAGGTKSPSTKPQKTNQSVKSDHSVVSAKTDITYSSDEDGMKLSKSESLSKEPQKYSDIENKEQEVEETLEYTPTEVAQHSKEELTEENLSKPQPSQLKEEVSQKADNEMNSFPNSISRPMPIPNQSQYISAPMIPTMNSNSYTSSSNPFPMASKAPINQQQSQQQHQLTQDTTPGPKLPERKNANPWSDFTNNLKSAPMTKVSSHPGTMNAVPTLNSQNKLNHLNANNIHDQFNNMSIYDSQRPKNFDPSSLPNNQAEPNLIDLEVGLDSSSSASGTPGATPLALPKQRDGNNRLESEPSLLDLKDLDDKQAKAPETKPQFKKRISSIQNASNFSFQEEVIDFASDDENPENSSKMNRISIRNSLKKPKGRKSGEHKRTDSSNGEGSKKRISFFGGSSSNNS